MYRIGITLLLALSVVVSSGCKGNDSGNGKSTVEPDITADNETNTNTNTNTATNNILVVHQFIPSGYEIQHESNTNLGSIVSAGAYAVKTNDLPTPCTSPEKTYYEIGYVTFSDPAMVVQAVQDAQKLCEEHAALQNNPTRWFDGKEAIKSGGMIYWYKGTWLCGDDKDGNAVSVDYYQAEIFKQINNGVLSINISDFYGDRDTIRKLFD